MATAQVILPIKFIEQTCVTISVNVKFNPIGQDIAIKFSKPCLVYKFLLLENGDTVKHSIIMAKV